MAPERRLRVALIDSHPIQYRAPWLRGLAQRCDLQVFFAYHPTPDDQAQAGYGVAFDWDVDLTSGYAHEFLHNRARQPNVYRWSGCDTPEIAAKIRSGGFDAAIVHGWYLKTFWQAAFACRRAGVPLLVRGDSQLGSPRSLAKRRVKELVYRLGAQQFDGFLASGTRNQEYLCHYGVDRGHIHCVPHCIDEAFFGTRAELTPDERAQLRARFGAAEGATIVLFVGRLIDFKRPLDVVQAAAKLRAAGEIFHVAFVGAGPLEGAIRDQAARLGASIALLGFHNQTELPKLYAAADMLVLPSNAQETWGLVVNEAMVCGTPAVVSDAAGCAPDLIDDGSTGHVYRCGDVDALARALLATKRLLGTAQLSAALAAKMQAFGCERAVAATLEAIEATRARLR